MLLNEKDIVCSFKERDTGIIYEMYNISCDYILMINNQRDYKEFNDSIEVINYLENREDIEMLYICKGLIEDIQQYGINDDDTPYQMYYCAYDYMMDKLEY